MTQRPWPDRVYDPTKPIVARCARERCTALVSPRFGGGPVCIGCRRREGR